MKVGFLGAGKHAENMAYTMKNMKDDVELYAVAARDICRAEKFAKKYGFKKAYGNYEDMLKDESIDLIYISTTIALHYPHIKICLDHGKHVLCEKGFVLNEQQAREVFDIAEKKGLLLTEAIWTRYMPSRRMIDLLLKKEIIGNVTSLTANLGYSLAHVERLQDLNQGGGTVLDLTIYTLNFACMVFQEEVESIHAVCTKAERGADAQNSVTLVFQNGKIATLFSSFVVQTDRRGVIYGDKGFIEIENINNCEKITVYNLDRQVIYEEKVPVQITGLEYEVLSCKKALEERKIECPEMPHRESIRMMKIMDEIRRQLDVKFPQEELTAGINAAEFAEFLMKKYPKADGYPYKSWSYPQGFLLWGFIRLYEKTGREDFLRYILEYCEEHVAEDGEIIGYTGESLDDIMPASVIVWAYTVTKKERYRKAADKVRADFCSYPRNLDGGFWHGKQLPGEMWVDGLFMGLMFLIRYGAYISDKSYCFQESIHQLNTIYARCRKDRTGLLYHAYSERKETPWANRITGCSPEVWSEGLGWYAMILVEVLSFLPAEWEQRDSLTDQLKHLCEDLIKVQDKECGLWYQVVDKPGFPGNFHDTSGSAMFLYTLKKACDMAIVDGEEVKCAIQKGYEGLQSKCQTDLDGEYHVLDACNGLCVQNHYEAYVNYVKTVDAQEAVAAVLWALTAIGE